MTLLEIALAITAESVTAGMDMSLDGDQSPTARAARLINPLVGFGEHAYIVEGDPFGWGRGAAVATILMEQKGGEGDCGVPLSYYEDGLDVAIRASRRMPGHHIEFENAAVALVFES